MYLKLKNNQFSIKKSAGFTLIELSVILVILSFAAVSMVVANQDVQKIGKAKSTEQTIKKINKALMKYAKKFGAFPCPSIPYLLANNANFGIAANNPGDCDNSGSDTGIITSTDGFSYKGGVPIRTLGLKPEDIADGWNHRLTYIVAKEVTLNTTYTDQTSLILLNDYSNSTANPANWYMNTSNTTYTKRANIPFILISAGENGFGTYKMIPSSQDINSRIAPITAQTSVPEALNYKMVDNTASSGVDESVLNNIYVKPNDIVNNFDDIVFAGRRYPISSTYPDFDPRTLDAGNTFLTNAIRLVAWYNADDPSSLTSQSAGCSDTTAISNGEEIKCWRDLSGNANHLTPTSSNIPTYITNNINTSSSSSNGNMVHFAGGSDENLKSANFNLAGSTLNMKVPFTIFVVLKNTDWSEEKYIYDNNTTSHESSLRIATTGGGRFDNRFVSDTITGSQIVTNNQNLFVISSIFDGNNSMNFRNGKKSSNTVGVSITTKMDGITVGSDRDDSDNMTGDIAELIIFKGKIPKKLRRKIEKMLANKWTDESDTTTPTNNIDMVIE